MPALDPTPNLPALDPTSNIDSFADKAGLPEMNVTLEYENPTNNGIALVTKALVYRMEGSIPEETFNDILYNPGYAPMERLVRAAAVYFDVTDPYNIPSEDKELYALDFANDWERLAFAINPEMFLKEGASSSNIEQPSQPADPIGGMV